MPWRVASWIRSTVSYCRRDPERREEMMNPLQHVPRHRSDREVAGCAPVALEVTPQESGYYGLGSGPQARRNLDYLGWSACTELLDHSAYIHARDLQDRARPCDPIRPRLAEESREDLGEMLDQLVLLPTGRKDELGRLAIVVAPRDVPVCHHVADQFGELHTPLNGQNRRLACLVRSGQTDVNREIAPEQPIPEAHVHGVANAERGGFLPFSPAPHPVLGAATEDDARRQPQGEGRPHTGHLRREHASRSPGRPNEICRTDLLNSDHAALGVDQSSSGK